MKESVLHSESTLTNRYQTTIPEPIRNVLKLHKRDKIAYDILSDGQVVITRTSDKPADDPVFSQFLDFLEQDMLTHPEHIHVISQKLLDDSNALIGHINDINLDEPLSSEDE